MYTLFLGREKTIIFKNEKESLKFLKTDEILFLWREHHDLVIIADLLNIPIDVIITKENVVTGHVQITPSERNKSDIVKFSGGRMVLMFDSEKNVDIRHDLLSYTEDLHPAPVCQNNPCSEAAELRAALVKAQETASEALLKITEMKEKMNKVKEVHNKMSMFVAEFFAEKKQ